MKVIVISGSPRKDGTSKQVLNYLVNNINISHNVEVFDSIGMETNGCIGCYECHESFNSINCIFPDGISGLLEKIMEADLIVYVTSIYAWGFPSKMKAIIERHYAFVKFTDGGIKSLIQNKKSVLLATCAGGKEDNADLITKVFEREMTRLSVETFEPLIIDHCVNPADLKLKHFKQVELLAEKINECH